MYSDNDMPDERLVQRREVRAPGAEWSPIYCGKSDSANCEGLRGRMRKYYNSEKDLVGPIDSPDPNSYAYKYKTGQMQDVLTRGCDMRVRSQTSVAVWLSRTRRSRCLRPD